MGLDARLLLHLGDRVQDHARLVRQLDHAVVLLEMVAHGLVSVDRAGQAEAVQHRALELVEHARVGLHSQAAS